jgi:CRP/FNR family transcriptional regulator, cyclic AMP receptor protein
MRESKYLKDDIKNIEKLMVIPVFKEFEVESLAGLLKVSKIREYENGEQIIKEGEHDSWLYFLYSGRVKIVKHKKILADFRRCGDVFGEMGMIGGFDRSASAFAVGKTVCLTTDASKISEITGKDKLAFSYLLYRIFAEIITERLKNTTEELIRAREEIAELKADEIDMPNEARKGLAVVG